MKPLELAAAMMAASVAAQSADSENKAEMSIRGTTCFLALTAGHWTGSTTGASNAKCRARLAEMRWRDLLCWLTRAVRNDQLSRYASRVMLAAWDSWLFGGER
jgi:hypothetical protein